MSKKDKQPAQEPDVKITAKGGTKECPQCGVTTVKTGMHQCPHCDYHFTKADRKKKNKINKGRRKHSSHQPRSNFGLTMVWAAPGGSPVTLVANNPNDPTDDEVQFWAEAVQEHARTKNQYYNVNVLKSFLAQFLDSQSDRYFDLCDLLQDLEYGVNPPLNDIHDTDFYSQQDYWEDHMGGYGGSHMPGAGRSTSRYDNFYGHRTGIGFQYGNTKKYDAPKPDVQKRYPRGEEAAVLEDDGLGYEICFDNVEKEKRKKRYW